MSIQEQCVAIQKLHHDAILQWNINGVNYQYPGFLHLVEINHACNYQLWHAEDRARRKDKGDAFVCNAKREIDQFNQQRNNAMETMDSSLYEELQPSTEPHCPLHSETPGMMIDRLSILSLKAYHMALQKERSDVDETHRVQCSQKLIIVQKQEKQLRHCLQRLLEEVYNKTRTFSVYHQFKMYNDPTLNPQLYPTNPTPPASV